MGKVKNSLPWCDVCAVPLGIEELRCWHDDTSQDHTCRECYYSGSHEGMAGLEAPEWDDLPPLDMKEGIWR